MECPCACVFLHGRLFNKLTILTFSFFTRHWEHHHHIGWLSLKLKLNSYLLNGKIGSFLFGRFHFCFVGYCVVLEVNTWLHLVLHYCRHCFHCMFYFCLFSFNSIMFIVLFCFTNTNRQNHWTKTVQKKKHKLNPNQCLFFFKFYYYSIIIFFQTTKNRFIFHHQDSFWFFNKIFLFSKNKFFKYFFPLFPILYISDSISLSLLLSLLWNSF